MTLNENAPFVQSRSKGETERCEVISLRSMEGFDKLSPNGRGMSK